MNENTVRMEISDDDRVKIMLSDVNWETIKDSHHKELNSLYSALTYAEDMIPRFTGTSLEYKIDIFMSERETIIEAMHDIIQKHKYNIEG